MKLFKLFAIVVLAFSGTLYVHGQGQPVNVQSTGGTTALTGNGTTGAGSLRVTIASDNTAFSVNATLATETTKTIGVIRAADGAGNLLTSNSTTYTAKFGLDSNLLGTLGTAFTTAGKVDVKGADGDVFVRQATAANLNATVVQATGSNLHVVCDSGCSASSTISLIPATSGGLSMFHLIAAATDNATSVKGSAGQLYGASVYNNTTYPIYLKFCNKATACTCGTNTSSDTILFTLAAQAGTEREMHTEEGIAFGTGIGICGQKDMADTTHTSLAANDGIFDLLYK